MLKGFTLGFQLTFTSISIFYHKIDFLAILFLILGFLGYVQSQMRRSTLHDAHFLTREVMTETNCLSLKAEDGGCR
jgi:hypothetical protein